MFFFHHSLFVLCGFVGFKASASNTWRTKASLPVPTFGSFVFREMIVSLEALLFAYFLSGFELLMGFLSLLLGPVLLLGSPPLRVGQRARLWSPPPLFRLQTWSGACLLSPSSAPEAWNLPAEMEVWSFSSLAAVHLSRLQTRKRGCNCTEGQSET